MDRNRYNVNSPLKIICDGRPGTPRRPRGGALLLPVPGEAVRRIGGMRFTRGIRAWLSCRLAPEMPTETGRPERSVTRWIFEPYLPRSTGFGPVRSPLSGPACSPSRSRTATSPARHARPVRRGPGGGAWPIPWPSTTPKTAGGRRSGRAERRGRQLLPGATRRCHEHDRGQHLPVTVPPPATTLRPRRRLRHHPLEDELTEVSFSIRHAAVLELAGDEGWSSRHGDLPGLMREARASYDRTATFLRADFSMYIDGPVVRELDLPALRPAIPSTGPEAGSE